MLFRVEINNFRSIKKAVIDLKKTKYEVLEKENVSPNSILKGAMFVGPNASGKSNILLALKLLLELLFDEVKISDNDLNICLLNEKPKPLKISYFFIIDNAEINYAIYYDPLRKILSEKLFVDKSIRLERLGNTARVAIDGKSEVTYGSDEIDAETLLLRKVYYDTNRFVGNTVMQKWYNFLINSAFFDSTRYDVETFGKDLNISSETFRKKGGLDTVNSFLKHNKIGYTIDFGHEVKFGEYYLKSSESKDAPLVKRDNLELTIPIIEESFGNITLSHFLPVYLHVIANNGMLLVDEFSGAFHNFLEKFLIRYFMINSVESQIFVVSHSTNLLTTTLFRPDQLFALSFEGSNGSMLTRFSEEKPRFGQNLEKMYLSGVFGGLPEYTKLFGTNEE